jgi:filamentous hemagglutinin family protein
VASGAASRAVSGANMTITQQSQRAVLDWQSFNVSADAQVRFDQPNSTAAALNRIHDANPSVIQGQLTANGEVYLINANGILFDKGAQVNVGGLVASALGISQDTFNAGLLSVPLGQAAFSFGGDAEAFASSEVAVEAGAQISAANGGRVMLLAPRVRNAGSISTPQGQAVLAGGDKVYLALPQSAQLRGFLVEVDPHATAGGGSVVNALGARVHADRGNVTLVGSTVRQDGEASATSAVGLNGSVRLLARDGATASDTLVANNGGALTLGSGSVTAVTPADDPATARDDAPSAASSIELAGRTVHLQGGAQVLAPGGNVSISAQRGAQFVTDGAAREDVRVQIDAGARIDVSGLLEVPVPVERNVVGVELRGDELKDSPLQRDGLLRNKTVFVDARVGTGLADASGALAGIERGIAERSTSGGDITLRSEGDVIVRSGAVLDVSGGSVLWQGGVIGTTQLVGEDGRLYDISVASPDRRYLAIAGRYAMTDPKWGVRREYNTLPGRYEAAYAQGRPPGAPAR